MRWFRYWKLWKGRHRKKPNKARMAMGSAAPVVGPSKWRLAPALLPDATLKQAIFETVDRKKDGSGRSRTSGRACHATVGTYTNWPDPGGVSRWYLRADSNFPGFLPESRYTEPFRQAFGADRSG